MLWELRRSAKLFGIQNPETQGLAEFLTVTWVETMRITVTYSVPACTFFTAWTSG